MSERSTNDALKLTTRLRFTRGAKHMGESHRRAWLPAAILVGLGYAVVGIVFAMPTTHAHAWRWAAWIVSAVGYAAHLAHECFRVRNSPFSSALHIAIAVALGAFGMAVGANIHSLRSGTTDDHRQRLLLALAIWPIITAIPAFVVALVASALLARARGRAPGQSV